MSSLSLNLLGCFGAHLESHPIENPGVKAQALLIYLAVEQHPQRREHLLTLLWPGMPEKSARHNLSQAIYALRQELPESPALAGDELIPWLFTDRQTVQLNPAIQIEVDLHQMDRLLQSTRVHDHLDLADCDACIQSLEQAASLYRGDFLGDFYLEDSLEFEHWAQAIRENYRRKTLDTLETLTTIYIDQKAYEEARAFAQRQLEIDNLRESAYRQLMEILARSDQRVEALSLYESCRQLLNDELGMAPTARTIALYDNIRAGTLGLEAPKEQDVRGYQLKEKIGAGTYGVIYRAIQTTVSREVAVKII
ncbi:MAG: BTAD domain-containing putative transcriptional regulator, partial [Anaerolineales bacterium]